MKSCNKLKLTESAQPVHTTHLRTTKFNILACAPIYPLPRVFSGIKVVKTKLSECSPNNVHTLPIHILSNLILVVQTGSSFDAHDRELVRPPPLPPHTPTHPGRMGCYCMGIFGRACKEMQAHKLTPTHTHGHTHKHVHQVVKSAQAVHPRKTCALELQPLLYSSGAWGCERCDPVEEVATETFDSWESTQVCESVCEHRRFCW